jgi:hypothetical protein
MGKATKSVRSPASGTSSGKTIDQIEIEAMTFLEQNDYENALEKLKLAYSMDKERTDILDTVIYFFFHPHYQPDKIYNFQFFIQLYY